MYLSQLLQTNLLSETVASQLQLSFSCSNSVIEILGWCPAGPVLPHGEKVPLYLALVGDPSSDGVTMKMSYGVDVLH